MDNICGICKKAFKNDDRSTIRESWFDVGGYGPVPKFAIVHPECNKMEQQKLKNGIIKLTELYQKVPPDPRDE